MTSNTDPASTTALAAAATPAPGGLGLWGPLRSVAFTIDPERVHHLSMAGLSAWSRVCRVDLRGDDVARAPDFAVEAFGLRFPNPIGLAAGFDKDARCVPAWQALGFGFVEVGTVTRHAQPGNDKPRLFRLPQDGGLMNRLGFNNQGADACARRLEAWRAAGKVRVPLGVNVGKSKITAADDAPSDYAYSVKVTADVADYLVVNVSSPNTPGLRDLQQRDALSRILDAVDAENAARATPRPVLVKIAPDMADDDAVDTARLVAERGCAGVIISNTTVSREGLIGPVPEGSGGVSGRPVQARSTALIRLVHEALPPLPIIGVGGVMDAASAQEKLDAGATLLQAYTGFVYGGPGFVRRTLAGLSIGEPQSGP